MILFGGAIALIAALTWFPGVQAGARTSVTPSIQAESQIDFPLGQRCVVPVDPLATSKPVVAGTANIVTGFAAPDTVEGILIRIDSDWIVLRDGCDENWIPMKKVLLVHACF